MKTRLQQHWKYLLLIAVIGIFFFLPFMQPQHSLHSGDWRLVHQSSIVILQNSIEEGSLPLWTPLLSGGTPFFAIPDKPLSYPPMIAMVHFFDAVSALNYSLIFHVILAGIGMYCFMRKERGSKEAGVIAASLFMFITPFLPPFWVLALGWMPFAFLFTKLALEKEQWITYSVLAAVCLAFMFHAGGVFHFYLAYLFLIPYLFLLILRNKERKPLLIKAIKIVIVLTVFFFGFIAIRFLPFQEWTASTSRSGALPLEVTMKNKLDFSNAFHHLVDGARGKAQIGYVGLLLCLLGVWQGWKRKDTRVITTSLLALGALIVVTGIFHSFFYHWIPGFDKQRGLIRLLFILSFFLAMLAGFGYDFVRSRLRKLHRYSFLGIVFLIVLDLFLFSSVWVSLEPYDAVIKDNEMMTYLAEQQEKEASFRIHSYEIRGIDYNDIQMLTIPANVEMLYGHYGGLWVPEWLNEVLGIALQSPAKMWGAYNVKYVTANQEISVPGLTLHKTFAEDPHTPIDYMDGPYLYENEHVLPRAAAYEHVILVLGEYETAKRTAYSLLLLDTLNTSTTLVVVGDKEKIQQYSSSFLTHVDGIVLSAGSLDPSSRFALERYKDSGGHLFPDVLAGATEVRVQDISSFFATLKTPLSPLPLTHQGNQHLTVAYNRTGFLYLAEKFSMFPGWKAEVEGKTIPYYRAQASGTALLAEGDVTFTYQPTTFVLGKWITLLTCLLACFVFWRKK